MRKSIILLIAVIIFTVTPVWAWGEGRYQATGGGTGMVLILDTEKGHFWIIAGISGVIYGGKVSTTDMKAGEKRMFSKKDSKLSKGK